MKIAVAAMYIHVYFPIDFILFFGYRLDPLEQIRDTCYCWVHPQKTIRLRQEASHCQLPARKSGLNWEHFRLCPLLFVAFSADSVLLHTHTEIYELKYRQMKSQSLKGNRNLKCLPSDLFYIQP